MPEPEVKTKLPDGKFDTIPTKDWEIVRRLQTQTFMELEKQGFVLEKGELPLYTKFMRSRKNKNTVIVRVPGKAPLTLDLLKGETLDHSFIVGPLPKDKSTALDDNAAPSILYALQHDRTRWFSTKYLYRTKYEDKNTRVKYAIPDSAAMANGAKILVYKTEQGEHGNVPDIGIRVVPPYVVPATDNKAAATQNFMFYAGPTLSEKLPRDKIFSIIRQVCDIVKKGNEEGILYNDLKPANFGYLKEENLVRPIDDGSVVRIDETFFEVLITPEYASPELCTACSNNLGPLKVPITITIASDIYSLGRIIKEIALQAYQGLWRPTEQERENFAIVNKLGNLMTRRNPDERVSHTFVSQCLDENNKALILYLLTDFPDSYTEQMQKNIESVFQLLSKLPDKASQEQLHALILCFELLPDVIRGDLAQVPWRNILHVEHGRALACAVATAEQQIRLYYPQKKLFSTSGQPEKYNKARNLLIAILNLDVSKPDTVSQIQTITAELEKNAPPVQAQAKPQQSKSNKTADLFAGTAASKQQLTVEQSEDQVQQQVPRAPFRI